jgi:hypothetical protein
LALRAKAAPNKANGGVGTLYFGVFISFRIRV